MEKLLKIKDVAEILGMRPNSIYRLIYQKKIPFVRLGRAVRFKESQLAAWIYKSSYDKITGGK